MGLASLTGQVTRASYDEVQWSEAELALFEVASLVAGALVGVLHLLDTVYEAWPLPTTRARGKGSHPDRGATSGRSSARSTR